MDSWLVTECDLWNGSSTAPSAITLLRPASPSAHTVGLHIPWHHTCNQQHLFRHCHLAFSVPHAQACPFAGLSNEPPQMLFLEARTVIKGAGIQPQQLPAFSITPQDVTNDPIKSCCSQESWLGLTLRKRQKFPVLLLFFSCVSSFVLSSCFY